MDGVVVSSVGAQSNFIKLATMCKVRPNMNLKNIKNIQDRSLRITVLGSGYVGLPTAVLFADAGFHVIALDTKPEVVKAVNNGVSLFSEHGLEELVSRNVQAGRLRATLNPDEALSQADAVIISVQTPIDQNKKPSLSFLTKALEEVGKTLRKEMIVLVSSTVPPRTMLEKIKQMFEFLSGLKADTDFYLAYVPERIAPGKALREFVESPRLVGGIGSNSTKIAAELFRTVCNKVIGTDAATAEVAKLAENTFRDINIAFANQLALICEQLGVDVMEVIKLANTHPRVDIHTPGPGVGGPCIPKDSYLLLYRSKPLDHDIVKTARQINDCMPKHTVNLILHTLNKSEKYVRNSKVTLLGTAYKGDVDDSRLSPSEPLIHELIRLGAEVTVYDPCSNESFGAKKADSLYEAVKGTDCLVIVTDHTEFKQLDLGHIRTLVDTHIIVDCKRIINPYNAIEHCFKYYGIGFGMKLCT